jgi:tetratricopeptide (TPR) repeat protein
MAETDKTHQTSTIQQKISGGQYNEALADIQRVLSADPDNTDARYMAAVCCRYLSRFTQAESYLEPLKSVSNDRGRVFQEQGHLDLARGRPRQALAAFANACQLNPALVASWRAQAQILASLEQPEEAQQASAQVKRLETMPRALVAVSDLLAQGKLAKAEAICRKFLRANPAHVEGMRLLAQIAVEFGVLDEAQFLLESASEFDTDNLQVRIDLIGVLRKRQRFEQALAAARALYDEHPENLQFQSLYAIEKMQIGDYTGAIALFDSVLGALPNDAVTLTSRGHAQKTLGRSDAAIQSYRAAIAADPWHGDAYYALSNLKTYRFGDDELAQMLDYESREEVGPTSQVYFCFALGKAFEDAGDFARAFEYYARGNMLKRQHSRYDAQQMNEDLRAQRDFFSRDMVDRLANGGYHAPDPIFIVGLPRAGSTLLEQILSSHSLVDGTLELPNILSMAQKLRRAGREEGAAPYPHSLLDLSAQARSELGNLYINDTRVHRQGAPFFIDKMPNNFRHIGLIRAILPNAKIIDARRHPMACCFSGFKQLFAEGQEFSYSLGDIGRYYNDYVELMDHWDQVAPGAVLRVQYEDVVDDLETQVRRILAYCDLPFEQACLEFHQTDRAVRTASSEQVRQPIYRDGVEQWVHFAPYLTELEELLAPSLVRYAVDRH